MSLTPAQFIGAWSLASWRIEYSDGRVTYPFGKDAQGQILYSADSQMSATVSAVSRKSLGSGNIRHASTNDKAEAYESYFHYAGSWRIESEYVVHTVTLGLNPDFVGSKQRRLAEFQGKELRLSAHEDIGEGITRHHILEWEKGNPL